MIARAQVAVNEIKQSCGVPRINDLDCWIILRAPIAKGLVLGPTLRRPKLATFLEVSKSSSERRICAGTWRHSINLPISFIDPSFPFNGDPDA